MVRRLILWGTAFLGLTAVACSGNTRPEGEATSVSPAVSATTDTPSVATATSPAPASLQIESMVASGSCLYASNNAAGTAVQTAPCANITGMQWQMRDGMWMNLSGVCLDAANPADPNTATVPILSTCNPYSLTQQWTYLGDTLRLSNTTNCLQWPTTYSGTSALLTLGPCLDATPDIAQQWKLGGSQGFRIVDPLAPTSCLRPAQHEAAAGAPIVMGPCPSNEPLWHLDDDTLTYNGLCMDLAQPTAADGGTMLLATCTGSANQKWFARLGHVRLDAVFECIQLTTTGFSDGQEVVLGTCDVNSSAQEVWIE